MIMWDAEAEYCQRYGLVETAYCQRHGFAYPCLTGDRRRDCAGCRAEARERQVNEEGRRYDFLPAVIAVCFVMITLVAFAVGFNIGLCLR